MVRVKLDVTYGEHVRAQFLHLRPRPVYAVIGVLVCIVFLGFECWVLCHPSQFTVYDLSIVGLGVLGLVVSSLLGFLVIVARAIGAIEVPGYTMTILVLMFFGALNLLGLGIVGSYAWRAYENSKRRPDAILATRHLNFEGD